MQALLERKEVKIQEFEAQLAKTLPRTAPAALAPGTYYGAYGPHYAPYPSAAAYPVTGMAGAPPVYFPPAWGLGPGSRRPAAAPTVASERRWADYLAPTSNVGLESKLPQLSALLARHASAADSQKRSMEHHQQWLQTFSKKLEDEEHKHQEGATPSRSGRPATGGTRPTGTEFGSPAGTGRPLRPRAAFDDDDGADDVVRRRPGREGDNGQDIVIRLRLEK